MNHIQTKEKNIINDVKETNDEKFRQKAIACALYAIPKLGSRKLNRLTEYAHTPEGILKMRPSEAKEIIGSDLLSEVLTCYENNPEELLRRMEQFYEEYVKDGINFVFIGEKEYPKKLLRLPDAPFGLFYKGSLPDEGRPAVSIIGARECSEYGRRCAELFGKVLGGNGVQIISGMARGVDGISQSAALDVGGSSFGILGCGVDIIYPKENRYLYENLCKNGGVISEYIPKTEAKSNLFPARNRLISAFCDILLVVEARKKSGTYITVCQALEQGKEIFAIPGRITDALSDGCNSLIKDGAGMASDPESVLDALAAMGVWSEGDGAGSDGLIKDLRESVIEEDNHPDGNSNGITGTRKALHSAILRVTEETPKPIEEIQISLANFGIEISYADLLCALTDLCISGRVEGLGNYYRKL